jgi:uncharacterized protein involved in exopolysaccharide biosynthesis
MMANPAITNIAPFLGISTSTTNEKIILNILKSRAIRERIVNQFNLKDYYKCLRLDSAINSLGGVTKISPSKDGIISIDVEDKDPEMAAKIANAYIEHLNHLNTEFGIGTASRQRRFIAEQLAKAEKNLKDAEDTLKEFQEKHRAISLVDQARGAVDASATIRSEIATAEVQLQVMQNFTKDSHPEVISLRRKIQELKRQLAKSQYSTGLDLPSETGNPEYTKKEIYVPVANIPRVGLELGRLARDVKVQEAVYTFLTQELERAKIDEVRDLPVVQPLDPAVPAIYKCKPQIKKNILLSGVVSLFLSIFVAFSLEYINKQRVKGLKG